MNNILKYRHPFHIVNPSQWPIYMALVLCSCVGSVVLYFQYFSWALLFLSISLFSLFCFFCFWFSDIIFEATYQGMHTSFVQKGLHLGMILFIISEIMFFISFFWAFFHSSLAPAIQIAGIWPPKGILILEPFEIPLVNTLLLLLSGVWATIAHHIIKFQISEFFLFASRSLFLAISLVSFNDKEPPFFLIGTPP